MMHQDQGTALAPFYQTSACCAAATNEHTCTMVSTYKVKVVFSLCGEAFVDSCLESPTVICRVVQGLILNQWPQLLAQPVLVYTPCCSCCLINSRSHETRVYQSPNCPPQSSKNWLQVCWMVVHGVEQQPRLYPLIYCRLIPV